jgi:hypothetical protein
MSITQEEFHRLNQALVDLRQENYQIKEKNAVVTAELDRQVEENKKYSDELKRAKSAISRSKKAQEMEMVLVEKSTLEAKMRSMREDFGLEVRCLVEDYSNAAYILMLLYLYLSVLL